MGTGHDFVVDYVGQFVETLKLKPLKIYSYPLNELQSDFSQWREWEHAPGLYYILDGNTLLIIGRASPRNGIGNRLNTLLQDDRERYWREQPELRRLTCGIVAFEPSEWHWTASLEVFITAKTGRPVYAQASPEIATTLRLNGTY